MKRINKSDLDKFYTKEDLAIELISKIDLSKYDLVIDPCCGDGSFYSNINHSNKIGIDILPHIDGVIEHDYLTWDHSFIDIKSDKILAISNPPFGKQGSLAIKFIKKSSEFADTIAFILPISFSKVSFKNKMPKYYHLVHEEILPDDSYLLDGVDYSVKCVVQIWSKKDYERDFIETVSEVGFKYTKDKYSADISIRRVGIYAGRGFKEVDKSEQSHYFIILDDKTKCDLVVEELSNVEWVDLTVGPRSISKNELNVILNNILNS
jgi:predicted RNA methylase